MAYVKAVVLGRLGAADAAREAIEKFKKRLEQIHYPAGEACKDKMGIARLQCVIENLITRAAELRRV
ncbi:MAG: hypothetical protein DRN90_02135 [Thermoproteota archaeon]|nr:MAG: hypothetical protein DRN90_02135 [Candidatus Korarchaeota archaeon]